MPPLIPAKSIFGAIGDDAEVLSSILVNLPALGIAMATYLVLHVLFSSEYYANKDRGKDLETLVPSSRFRVLSGICTAMRLSDDEYVRIAGVDAAAFVEHLRVGFRILVGFLLWGLVTEVGLYYLAAQDYFARGGNVAEGFLARASIAGMDPVPTDGSWSPQQACSLLFSLVGLWLNSLLALRAINRSWQKVVGWCQASLADADDPVSHVVLVRASSPLTKPVTQAQAFATWDVLYPGSIYSVRVVRETGALPSLLAKYDALAKSKRELEVRRDQLIEDGKANQAEATTCCGGSSLAAKISKLEAKMALLTPKISALRDKCIGDEKDVGLSYFVIFTTSRAATMASQVSALPSASYTVSAAPVPTGVRWAALKQMGIRTRVPTRICAKIGYWAMFVLWSSGIAAINLVMNLESLYLVLPPVRDLLVALGPSVESFVGAFLPPLAYTIFMAILPMVCATFSSLYGLPSVGEVNASAFAGLFTFNFVYVFLAPSLSSSMLASVEAVIRNPGEIFAIITGICSGLASASTFFITFTLLKLVLLLNTELVRLVPTVLLYLKRKAGLTKDGAPPDPAKFHVLWMGVTLHMCIGINYASVAPITTVFSFM